MAMQATASTQYRTFNHLYVFKSKRDKSTSLKIYDTAQKRLAVVTLPPPPINSAQLDRGSSATSLLSLFTQSNLIASDYLPPVPQVDIAKELQQAILHAKTKISVENASTQLFTCPITMSVFEDPVIDNHGHTFERKEIEEHLEKNDRKCPLSREPITSLTPNRQIKDAIEAWKQQDPIPTLALFKKHNPVLFGKNLETAEACIAQKEYEEAIECYAKAFMYTNEWRNYAALPKLYEMKGDPDKATLAYLYLALYQHQDNKTGEVISTLEQCKKSNPSFPQTDNLLIQLYHASGRQAEAIQLALQCAQARTEANPQEAIRLYKQVLTYDPQQWKAYVPLSQLLKDPQERAHILLKGGHHALEAKDYERAQSFSTAARSSYEDSFLDRLIDLELLKRQNTPLLKEKLLDLAKTYEQKKLYLPMVKAYKMLTHLEYNPIYYKKIITHAPSPEKALKWNLRWLSAAIENKDWQVAEQVALSALQTSKAPIPLYTQLETIYTEWHNHELSNLWNLLGKAYLQNKQVDLAERTYRKAYDRFQTLDHALALGATLVEQNKIPESVQTYYEASEIALMSNDLGAVGQCVQKIRQIDASMAHLTRAQKIQMLSQSHISRLSMEVEALRGQSSSAAAPQASTPVAVAASSKTLTVPSMAFGAAAWKMYWGDVGVEKPLPPNIEEILNSPCPFWPGKKIRETHVLVYKPETVNGQPLSLAFLGELVQKPLQGNATKYEGLSTGTYPPNTPSGNSYWFLMTRDVIPESRGKSYADQQKLVATRSQKTKIAYEAPNVLDASLAIFSENVRSGTHLYGREPWTFTRCQEKYNADYHLVVGGFAPGGLCVHFATTSTATTTALQPSGSSEGHWHLNHWFLAAGHCSFVLFGRPAERGLGACAR